MSLVSEFGTGWETNRSELQAWLDDTQFRKYPLYWPGGALDKKHYLFDRTITIPATAGLKWSGMGLQDPDGYAGSDAGSFLCLRASSYATTFDGTSNLRLVSSGASTVCTVHGRATVAEDLYNSVYISGGTNATAGWYGITAVTPGASGTGTWTLGGSGSPTANWCSGAVTNGTGYYCPALIANKAYGMVVEGLAFTHKVLSGDSVGGQVLWHNLTTDETGGTAPAGHQTVFRDCSFGNADVAILDGTDMAGAFGNGAVTNWVNSDGLHADTNTLHSCIFSNIKACLYQRCSNGVWQDWQAIRVANLNGDVFRFDTGGKLNADTLWISGGSGRQNVLYLGPRVNSNMNPFIVRNVSFDGATVHPQLLVTDAGASFGATVTFDGGIIDAVDITPTVLDDYYLVDVDGDLTLTIRDMVGPNTASAVEPFWEGCMRFTAGTGTVLIERCQISIADPEDMIDEANTVAGWEFTFRDCYDGNYEAIPDSTYTTQ